MRSRRWGVVAMLVLALGVGAGANAIDSHYLASGWHTVVRGDEASDVRIGHYQIHVHGAASSSRVDDDGELVTSPQLFVTVDLSYATTDAWDAPDTVVLISGDGREFTNPGGGFGSAGQPWPAGPDIWFRGTLLYEVPASVIGDLTLEFRPESPDARFPASVARIPLTVTTTSEPIVLAGDAVLAEGER